MTSFKQLQRTVNSSNEYEITFLTDLHFHLEFTYFYIFTPENLSIISWYLFLQFKDMFTAGETLQGQITSLPLLLHSK